MPIFERSTVEEAPFDAVLVKIWRQTGRTVADVICSYCPNARELLVPGFPRPIPVALKRAEEMREVCGLARIVIVLEDDSLWRGEWGTLETSEAIPT